MSIISSKLAQFSKRLDSHIREADPPPPPNLANNSNKVKNSQPISKEAFVSLVGKKPRKFVDFSPKDSLRNLVNGKSRNV